MNDARPIIRRASEAESTMDTICNPMDLWCAYPIHMPPERIARAATGLWGEPGTSMADGEMLWWLRAEERWPVLIAVGVGNPEILFSATDPPDDPEGVVAEIGDLLARAYAR